MSFKRVGRGIGIRWHVIHANVWVACGGEEPLVLADLKLVDLAIRVWNGPPADASGGLPESDGVIIPGGRKHQRHSHWRAGTLCHCAQPRASHCIQVLQFSVITL